MKRLGGKKNQTHYFSLLIMNLTHFPQKNPFLNSCIFFILNHVLATTAQSIIVEEDLDEAFKKILQRDRVAGSWMREAVGKFSFIHETNNHILHGEALGEPVGMPRTWVWIVDIGWDCASLLEIVTTVSELCTFYLKYLWLAETSHISVEKEAISSDCACFAWDCCNWLRLCALQL